MVKISEQVKLGQFHNILGLNSILSYLLQITIKR